MKLKCSTIEDLKTAWKVFKEIENLNHHWIDSNKRSSFQISTMVKNFDQNSMESLKEKRDKHKLMKSKDNYSSDVNAGSEKALYTINSLKNISSWRQSQERSLEKYNSRSVMSPGFKVKVSNELWSTFLKQNFDSRGSR